MAVTLNSKKEHGLARGVNIFILNRLALEII